MFLSYFHLLSCFCCSFCCFYVMLFLFFPPCVPNSCWVFSCFCLLCFSVSSCSHFLLLYWACRNLIFSIFFSFSYSNWCILSFLILTSSRSSHLALFLMMYSVTPQYEAHFSFSSSFFLDFSIFAFLLFLAIFSFSVFFFFLFPPFTSFCLEFLLSLLFLLIVS